MRLLRAVDSHPFGGGRRVVVFVNIGARRRRILFRWTDGAFKLKAADTGLDRVAAEARAERVFIDLLREREAQGRPVSPTPSPTYPPTQFAPDPQSLPQVVVQLGSLAAYENLLETPRPGAVR